MFGFVTFGFKLLFAAIAGGALSYIPGQETQNHKIVETSLICIFGAAILGLTTQLHFGEFNIVTGAGILAVIMVIISISKNLDFINRMVWIFSGISGIIIGAGYIVQAILLLTLVYIIFRNSEQMLNYFDQETEHSDDGSIENVSN